MTYCPPIKYALKQSFSTSGTKKGLSQQPNLQLLLPVSLSTFLSNLHLTINNVIQQSGPKMENERLSLFSSRIAPFY
jgi:hypothetical protein